jgi:hypothetical protein
MNEDETKPAPPPAQIPSQTTLNGETPVETSDKAS